MKQISLRDEVAEYLFHQGTNYRAYDYLGSHKATIDGLNGYIFRCFAPRAMCVSVVGEFNNWDKQSHKMQAGAGGIWTLFIPNLSRYTAYKYLVTSQNGNEVFKSDPYGVHNELRPGTSSKLYDISGYQWGDEGWIKYRTKTDFTRMPVNIYEVHIASWRRYPDGNFYDYRKFAEEIIPYVKDMGYTHIELMGVAEHPFDGSWGYQVGNYFAINSRHGTPHDFMYLVDKLHQAGIGVIVDWVPGHFPKDEFGLIDWDGEALYEPANDFRKEHREWGTRCFDYGRTEVQSFLVSNADYFVKMYHIDGLRVDAVASMLYLDYNRKDGEWQQNSYGGKENLEAIAFLRKLNGHILGEYPNVLMIAEESTAWPMVTRPPEDGGLGFNFKWNMGWMNDTLSYMRTDPYFRKENHNNLTFSMMYAFAENFVLPLSHDEVVHGKGSLINKMPGEYTQKFANLKAYLSFMLTHPGKKILFMGGEIAQFDEWSEARELGWNLLGYATHASFKDYIRDLNRIYLHNKELSEVDTSWDGFSWLSVDDNLQNIVIFKRIDADGNEIVCAHNFAPVLREGYRIPLSPCRLVEILNSNDIKYGGTGEGKNDEILAEDTPFKDSEYSAEITLPPMSSVLFKVVKVPSVKKRSTEIQKVQSREMQMAKGKEVKTAVGKEVRTVAEKHSEVKVVSKSSKSVAKPSEPLIKTPPKPSKKSSKK